LAYYAQPFKKDMTTKKPQNPEPHIGNGSAAASVGPLLLTLCNALREVERCRIALKAMGFPQKRWQEIVNDVNPELRFVLRGQMLDPIMTYLKSVGKPVERNRLQRALYNQAAGSMQRIRQSITTNLRAGQLTLYSGNKVGLPAWKKKAE
jgi:hypothetical protein